MSDKNKRYARYANIATEIKKDGHTMFLFDITNDLNRKSYLEELNDKNQERIKELKNALCELISVASECDGWESFPSGDIESANKVLNND